jgi:hypothetical protein
MTITDNAFAADCGKKRAMSSALENRPRATGRRASPTGHERVAGQVGD